MAGDWIKMEASTPDKPEVLAMTARMGWDDPDLTVGKLFRVWRWFDQQTTNGNAVGVTAALLDRIAGVAGFANAMAEAGWLVISEGGLSLPNFDKHNGATAKSRAQTAKRVANHRASEPSNADSNAPTVTGALAREEKRREDKETSNLTVAPARPEADRPLALVDSKPKGPPDCPHAAVLALWAEVLPAMPQHLPSQWRGSRADHLRARWRETAVEKGWASADDGLAYLRKLFGYVGKSRFLTGQAPNRDPTKRPFVVELEWLVSPTNWAKVIEGKYHEGAA